MRERLSDRMIAKPNKDIKMPPYNYNTTEETIAQEDSVRYSFASAILAAAMCS